MNFLRSVASLLVGMVVFAVPVRWIAANPSEDLGFLLLVTGTTVLAAMAAGFLAALIAGRHEFPHTAALGVLMVAMSLVAMRQEGTTRPGWHEIAIAGCGPVAAMIGAALRILARPKRAL